MLALCVHVTRAKLQKLEVLVFDKSPESSLSRTPVGQMRKIRPLGERLVVVPREVNVLFASKLRSFLSKGVEVALLRSLLPYYHSFGPLLIKIL